MSSDRPIQPMSAFVNIKPDLDGHMGKVARWSTADDSRSDATNAPAPPIASLRSRDIDLIGATMLTLWANKDRRCDPTAPFEERMIPPVSERFAWARAFCNGVVESERYLDPLVRKHTTLLLTVIATCLITGPNGEARSTDYQDIGAVLVATTGSKPYRRTTVAQAEALTRFLFDIAHSSAARLIPAVAEALRVLTALAPEALAYVADTATRAVAGMVGADRLSAADLSDADVETPSLGCYCLA